MTDPKLSGQRDEQQEQAKWYERTWIQVLLFTAGFILWGLTLWMLLNIYFAPQTSAQKQSLIPTMVVLLGGAAFLFAFSFIARYLQVPHYGVIAATFLVVVAVLWVLVRPETATERIRFFQTVGGIVGGSALLFGLYFTAQTLQVNREGQITERFTRAIEQLGATYDDGTPRIEIRLGGIYALERIAWDSPERDYSTVIEVLTAYVRENAPRSTGPPKEVSDVAMRRSHTLEQPPPSGRPNADIQAILDVLRRAQTRVSDEYRIRLDLHEANLVRADLRSANLQEADLQGADLQGADLQGADLQGAALREADLSWADLLGADLQRAKLTGANLVRAGLQYANLRRARLRAAGLQGAELEGTDLTESNLRHAEVTDAQLAKARSLQGASMPNGQEYEDWLKDQDGRSEDGVNPSPT